MQIQVARGTLDQREYDKLKSALKKFSLPTHLGKIDIQAILENTKNDKKMEAGQVKFILLEEIGKAVIDRTVSLDEMEAALKKFNMKNKKIRAIIFLILAAVGIFFDQWTKRLAVLHLMNQPSKTIIPGVFELSYLENPGAAFGMMRGKQFLFLSLWQWLFSRFCGCSFAFH